MKISAVPSLSNSTAASGPTNNPHVDLRSLKMTTNATPLSGVPPAAQELPISDTNETQATPEATQPLSPQFAELARRRRALQVKERALADREKALQAQSQGRDAVDLARLKSEPLNVLMEAGVTYDQLTEAILANQGSSEIHALKAELAALKEGVDKKFVDRETQAEQQVLAEMRKEATLLTSQSKDFELVKETRSVPDVMRLIEQTYRQTGEVLDVRDALKLVEDELFKDAQRIIGIDKVKSQLSPQNPAPMQQQPGMRTLTNKHTASVPMSARERALAAFYGTLKR